MEPNNTKLDGYCYCGCGGKTNISKWTDKRNGSIKGEPYKYLNGHSNKADINTRFWWYVLKTEYCWEWIGGKDTGGYGLIGANKTGLKAHRVSWEIHNGPLEKGLFVLHKCDNPKCVNPEHLFLGTQTDNMRDMVNKGRNKCSPKYGEDNPMARLTERQVAEIRLLKGSKSQANIAKDFNVSPMTVSRIINNQLWRMS